MDVPPMSSSSRGFTFPKLDGILSKFLQPLRMRVLSELKLPISVGRQGSLIQFLRFNKIKLNRFVIEIESSFMKVPSMCSSVKYPIRHPNSWKNSRPQLERTKVSRLSQVIANEKLLKLTQPSISNKIRWRRLFIESWTSCSVSQFRKINLWRFRTSEKSGVSTKCFESLTSISFKFLNNFCCKTNQLYLLC